jgi:hypothetical protein
VGANFDFLLPIFVSALQFSSFPASILRDRRLIPSWILTGEQVLCFAPEHAFSELLDLLLSAFGWLRFLVLLKHATCPGFSVFVSPSFVSSDLCVDCCKQEAGIILESQDQKTRGFGFKSLSHDDFPNAPTRCSVKCL